LANFGKVDFSTGHQTKMVVHEVTRAGEPDTAKLRQLNYYLHAVKELYGLDAEGILHLADRKTHAVSYDREAAIQDLEELRKLADEPPPPAQRLPICRGCTNYNWCFA
jgi:CRISPR/Cas system-associated exonuclease Cas4 (RecB family)